MRRRLLRLVLLALPGLLLGRPATHAQEPQAPVPEAARRFSRARGGPATWRLDALSVFPVGIVLVGCAATLPPAVQVHDFKPLAGKWKGTLTGPFGSVQQEMTIREDGSWENILLAPIDNSGLTRFQGVLLIRSGKILWISRTSGRSGTFTLHEGDGRRLLMGTTDSGSATMKLEAVQ